MSGERWLSGTRRPKEPCAVPAPRQQPVAALHPHGVVPAIDRDALRPLRDVAGEVEHAGRARVAKLRGRAGPRPMLRQVGGDRRSGVVPVAPGVEPRLRARRQQLPFPRPRQAASRPAREGVRRPPAHAGHRKVEVRRLPLPVVRDIVLVFRLLRVREQPGTGQRIRSGTSGTRGGSPRIAPPRSGGASVPPRRGGARASRNCASGRMTASRARRTSGGRPIGKLPALDPGGRACAVAPGPLPGRRGVVYAAEAEVMAAGRRLDGKPRRVERVEGSRPGTNRGRSVRGPAAGCPAAPRGCPRSTPSRCR